MGKNCPLLSGALRALALCFIAIKVMAQPVIVAAEYYVDTDPGQGKATPIPLTNLPNLSFTYDFNSLPQGLHVAGIRSRDANGSWSLDARYFFVNAKALAAPAAITGAEYYVDTDPGQGKATPIPLTNLPNLSFTYDFNSLPQGLHVAGIRSRDANGSWSLDARYFFVKPFPVNTRPEITAIEYYIDTDPGRGRGIPVPVTPGQDIANTVFMINFAGIENGYHKIGIRSRDTVGNWSLDVRQNISICPDGLAKAGFNIVKDKNEISLLNTSEWSHIFRWHVTSKDTVKTRNSFYSLTLGNYTATLVADNGCQKDTLKKIFTIEGLKSISPAKGGNIGFATIKIEGFGFTPGTTFSLTKPGKSLAYDTIVIQSNKLMISTLNLVGAETGLYNLTVNIPGAGSLQLPNAFEVEVGRQAAPVITITNPPIVRRGRPITIRVVVSNPGNNDMYGIPVLVDGLPSTKEGYQPSTEWPTMLPIVGLPTSPGNIDDFLSDSGRRFTGIIPFIPPNGNSSIILSYILDPTVTTPTTDLPPTNVEGSTFPPKQKPNIDLSECADCGKEAITDIVVDVVKNAAEITAILKFTPYSAWKDCIGGGIDLVYGLYKIANAKPPKDAATGNANALFSWSKLIVGGISTGVDCATAIRGSTPGGLLVNALHQTYKLYKKGVGDPFEKIETYITNPALCMATCIQATSSSRSGLAIRTSYDPNVKIGLGSTTNPYINRTKHLLYTIYFENASTATLPAQTVFIRDTIDKTKFDVNTIRFNSASVANQRTNFIDDGLQAIGEIDLRPRLNLKARVNALTDTAKGIITWQIQTIDPATNQETLDPLAGFLPPNLTNNEGDGSVSFSISVKNGIATSDQISNKASIVFDFNTPIVTDNWINTFDFVAPTSNLNALPDTVLADSTLLSFTGSDNLSGISHYNIYFSKNGSDYGPLAKGITGNNFLFKGEYDNNYSFIVQAEDRAGNIEPLDTTKRKKTFLRLIPTIFTFNGNGSYSEKSNWLNELMPPESLPKGSEIKVLPQAGGRCVLDHIQYLRPDSRFTVASGADILLLDRLQIR